MSTTDDPLFTPPASVSDPPKASEGDPAADDKLKDPAVQLAIEKAKNEAYERALAAQRDPIAPKIEETAPGPQLSAPPATWKQLLSPADRTKYEEMLVTHPIDAETFAEPYRQQHADWVMNYRAAPLVQSSARGIISEFKSRMIRRDGKMADQIEPLFDAAMRKYPDLRPLVGMTPEAADAELSLRWNSAKSEVQAHLLANPPKPEPMLTAPGSNPGTPAPAPQKTSVMDDPSIAFLNSRAKFTPEQLAELEAMT